MSQPALPTESGPVDPVYEYQINAKWFLGLEHVAVTLVLAILFCLFNAFPLRPTDLWTHVLYGNWILDHRALPNFDPFMPLAEGMNVVNSAWLSQVVLALTERAGGATAISLVFTLAVLGTYVVLMRAYYLQANVLSPAPRLLLSLVAMLGAVAVGWSRLTTVRPENFAVLCFAVLLWLLTADDVKYQQKDDSAGKSSHRFGLATWCGVPLVLMLWANLHGSFLVGLALLACFAFGRILTGLWYAGRLGAAFATSAVWQVVLLAELGVLATCVNPYGPDLLLHSLWFARHENLKELLEWQSLSLLGTGGRSFALSWVALVIGLRYSRARLPVWHVLALGLFAYAAVSGIRMLGWYAPVVMLVLVPHLAELGRLAGERFKAWQQATAEGEDGAWFELQRSPHYLLVCALIAFVAFVFSDLGLLLGYKPRSDALRYGKETPLALTEFLETRDDILASNIFNPQPWGDWLEWKFGDRIRPFITSNVHLVPRQTWQDYNRIVNAQPGWQVVLDRYRIETIVVDSTYQPVLYRVLKRDENWTSAYEDDQALVVRRRPAGPRLATSSAAAAKPEAAAAASPANALPASAAALGEAPPATENKP